MRLWHQEEWPYQWVNITSWLRESRWTRHNSGRHNLHFGDRNKSCFVYNRVASLHDLCPTWTFQTILHWYIRTFLLNTPDSIQDYTLEKNADNFFRIFNFEFGCKEVISNYTSSRFPKFVKEESVVVGDFWRVGFSRHRILTWVTFDHFRRLRLKRLLPPAPITFIRGDRWWLFRWIWGTF